MTDSTTDPHGLMYRVAALRTGHTTPAERRRAALVVAERVPDRADARTVLMALGLAPYPSKTGTRKQDRTGMGPHYNDERTTR